MKAAQHIPVQCAQGRDIYRLDALPLPGENPVEDRQASSLGLAGAGGRNE